LHPSLQAVSKITLLKQQTAVLETAIIALPTNMHLLQDTKAVVSECEMDWSQTQRVYNISNMYSSGGTSRNG